MGFDFAIENSSKMGVFDDLYYRYSQWKSVISVMGARWLFVRVGSGFFVCRMTIWGWSLHWKMGFVLMYDARFCLSE